MVKRNGTAGGSNANLRNRIEGFGNGPMPPPNDTIEDRLHNALATDETIGDWYNSARAGMDAMVTAFDDTVNAIADTIEDTVTAVVGDDDDWNDPQPQAQQNKRGGKGKGRDRKESQDDGERSGTNWADAVAAICEEGDLDNFVLKLRTTCANSAEEKEVAGFLSEQLLSADKSSKTIRTLYVMQAVEEGDCPVVLNDIRVRCQEKLEKLKGSSFFKALATQILGDGPAPKTEKEKREEEKKNKEKEKSQKEEKAKPAPKPVDLLDMEEKPKPTQDTKASSSSSGMVDLLDMASPAPAAQAADLLDMVPTPMLQPTPSATPAPAAVASSMPVIPGPGGQSAAGIPDLLNPQAVPSVAASPGVSSMLTQQPASNWNAFQGPSAPQQNLGHFAALNPGTSSASGVTGNYAALQPGGAAAAPAGAFSAMSQPFGAMSGGYQSANSFDPNKPSMPSMGGFAGAMGQPRPMQPQAAMKVVTGTVSSGKSAAKKDDLGLDDILSSEFAKMNAAR